MKARAGGEELENGWGGGRAPKSGWSLRAGGQAGQRRGAGSRAGAEGTETLVGDRQEDRQQDNTKNMGVLRVGSPGQTANKPGLVLLPEMGTASLLGAHTRPQMRAPWRAHLPPPDKATPFRKVGGFRV